MLRVASLHRLGRQTPQAEAGHPWNNAVGHRTSWMSLVNGTPLIPLGREGNWLLVAAACDLTPTFACHDCHESGLATHERFIALYRFTLAQGMAVAERSMAHNSVRLRGRPPPLPSARRFRVIDGGRS
jgi:hypothetical protein